MPLFLNLACLCRVVSMLCNAWDTYFWTAVGIHAFVPQGRLREILTEMASPGIPPSVADGLLALGLEVLGGKLADPWYVLVPPGRTNCRTQDRAISARPTR